MKKCLLFFLTTFIQVCLAGQVHADVSFPNGQRIIPQLENPQSIAFSSPPAPPCIPKHTASFSISDAVQCLDENKFNFLNTSTGTGDATYQWNFGDGQPFSAVVSPSHQYSGAKVYTVTLTVKDDLGCANVFSSTITVNENPATPVITYPRGGDVFCEGDSLILHAALDRTPNPTLSHKWSLGSTIIVDSNSCTAKQSGTYILIAENLNGCRDSSLGVVVTAHPNPVKPSLAVASGDELEFCQGDSTLLEVRSAVPGSKYSWYLSSTDVSNLIMGATSSEYQIKAPSNMAGLPITRSYIVKVENENKCSSPFSEPITTVVKPTPIVSLATLNGTLSFCEGDSAILKVTSRYGKNTYQWFNNRSPYSSGPDSLFISKSSGTFSVNATNSFMCSVTSNALQIVSFRLPDVPLVYSDDDVPEMLIDGTINICPETTVKLKTALFPSAVYQWYKDGATLNNGGANSVIVSASGNYKVNISVNSCTSTSNEKIVGLLPSPTGTLIAPSSNIICNGSQQTLNASGAVGYQWLLNEVPILGATGSSYSTPSQGVYTVEFSTDKGCKKMSSNFVNLSLVRKPAAKFSNDLFCINATSKFTNHSITANSGTVAYHWKFENGMTDNSMHTTHTFPVSGEYMVLLKVTPVACPQLADSAMVNITLESAQAGMSYTPITSMVGRSVSLVARPLGDFYEWTPAPGFNSPYIRIPILTTPEKEQLYTVKITSKSGCQVVDSQLVRIFDEQDILVAGGFTPNHDGRNDKVYPILIGIASFQYIKIFNRWGNLVFQTSSTDPEQGWDGTYQRQPQPADTYTWVVHGVGDNGREIRKSGSVILIR
jgi:gliding motility-associated-like protein